MKYCTRCENSGYIFDTYYPCDECELGKPKQLIQDKAELKSLYKRILILKKRIKENS